MVMLSLLFTILDEGGRGEGEDASEQQSAYITLVEESDGFDRTMALMNDHDDMEVYEKVRSPPFLPCCSFLDCNLFAGTKNA